MKNSLEFKVWGRYALFSDPVTRVGGEKSSYHVPTYEALKGIVKSIYWKPTIIWIIDRVRILRAFQTQTKGVKLHPLDAKNGAADLSFFTYLKNVEYEVSAHFIWNEHRPELAQDRIDGKHWNMAQRMLERGGRQDIFLGTRECQGYVAPCAFGEAKSDFEQSEELALGLMFHGFDYPDETGINQFAARFWRPVMRRGVIAFPPPEDASLLRKTIRPMRAKAFRLGENLSRDDEAFFTASEKTVAYPDARTLLQGESL